MSFWVYGLVVELQIYILAIGARLAHDVGSIPTTPTN